MGGGLPLIRLTVPDVSFEAVRPALEEIFASGWLVSGKHVERFETLLAERLGARHAVAVSSGTAALQLMLQAGGIGTGDEVLVPGYTFPATAAAVAHTGAVPVVVDVDPRTANMDPHALKDALNPATRAVMPVHQFGLACAWDAIAETVRGHGELILFEDAACALGARIGDRHCGALGRAAAFSFHPRKIITTGEGGAVTTDDDGLAEQVRLLRNHGMTGSGPARRFSAVGYNFRMSELHAVVGLAQLERLDEILALRRQAADWYREALDGLPVELSVDPEEAPHTYQTYAVRLPPERDVRVVAAALEARGVQAGSGADVLAATGLYRSIGPTPQAVALARSHLALPMHSRLTRKDVARVGVALREALERAIR